MKLILERRDQDDRTPVLGPFMLTPPVGEDYWTYRVRIAARQAVIGFPKFSTIGIGFAVEEDWNTNLPYTCDAQQIYEHIEHNRGSDISRETCVAAIRLIQDAATADRAVAASAWPLEPSTGDPHHQEHPMPDQTTPAALTPLDGEPTQDCTHTTGHTGPHHTGRDAEWTDTTVEERP
ncbi:hypothetical protein BJP40_19950 [Streptomyces sp. CC53]|uniref:hypothetical protein n=1 Tax=Streptomyces sp. CC53 TaxID=1906740 RepID=UPI0008DCE171|nr:hypothetical protein [Streptomyces sp. CC53]OII64614.1 hypothetical protein BJP40_19950 [Streptomyces sp. CC53]